jgi:hypothetical protein
MCVEPLSCWGMFLYDIEQSVQAIYDQFPLFVLYQSRRMWRPGYHPKVVHLMPTGSDSLVRLQLGCEILHDQDEPRRYYV